ncbi:protein that induces appearance of [PIN+] prion when overproduced [Sporothrix eucalyptigena]|uniref:Protein that induces appearance of [PIN+] prion when overproduced n=1 Tax=Sporothrix eucalyptigena TaxID=1812306 RepID=A0ABP0B8B6_9PEZI
MADTRQKAMDVNRSLRTIKTELENLLEKGAISDDDFNTFHDLLPQEWSLRGGHSPAPPRQAQPTQPTRLQPMQQGPPLPIRNNSHQSTASSISAASAASSAAPTPAPSDTTRDTNGPDSNGRTAVGFATAKYTYDAPNDGDLAFDRGDTVGVYSKVNDDWWLGRNVRSGKVGIFPRQYVKPEAALADLERAGQLPGPNDAPPPPMPPSSGGSRAPSTAPPSYYDQYGNPPPQQQQYANADAKYGQPYGQAPYEQQSYAQQPYSQQQQQYYGGGPSDQPPPQQQDAQNNGQVKSTGKKIGGKLGNAFVTGVGFAAGAELVGAIL